MGGPLRSVPPTPAHRLRDFADPPHRFAGGGEGRQTNPFSRRGLRPSVDADGISKKTSPRVIFVRLFRRWGRFGHDQRGARRKKLPLPGGERVGVRGFERLGKELQRLLPLTRSLSLATSPRRGEVKKQTKKEAERRKAQTSNLRTVRCGAAPAGAARLSAFHRGSCPRDCSSRRLSSGQASWAAAP